MPQITVSAQLIRITRTIQPGQWLLIRGDDNYEVLTHEQALALQGKVARTRTPATKIVPKGHAKMLQPVAHAHAIAVIPGATAAGVTPGVTSTIQSLGKLPHPLDFQVNGKTIHIQRQKLAILQYMAAHGSLTSAEATVLLGTDKPTTILSTLKTLGLVSSDSDPAKPYAAHVYTLTNEGRAVAQGSIPAAE